MGLAIGKKGENIRRMQNVLGKRIEMVEYSEDFPELVTNIFKPAEIVRIEKDAESGQIYVFVKKRSDLGIAIGKGGCTIEKARILARRFSGVEIGEVLIQEEESHD